MGRIFEIQKKLLLKQKKIVEKRKKDREKKAKEQAELEKIRQDIRASKKLNLTPSERKLLQERAKRKEKTIKSINNKLKFFGKGLVRLANNVANNVEKEFSTTKKRKKSKR